MKVCPLANRVMFKKQDEPKETKTSSGIILPDTAKKPSTNVQGIVVGIGIDVKEIKVGDHIIANSYSGSDVTVEGESYVLINENEIIGVITND